jgi:hypothetical protein
MGVTNKQKAGIFHKDACFHTCTNGTIRPYPTILCSLCDPKEPGVDFNAFAYVLKLEEFKRSLIKVKDAADGKTALFSCQGQGLDGYSELANYRQIIEKFR